MQFSFKQLFLIQNKLTSLSALRNKKNLDFLRSVNYNIFIGTQKRGEKMSPRTGRPKAENPKDIDVKVRFDRELNDKLLKYCEENNITRAEAIRQGVHLLLEKKK